MYKIMIVEDDKAIEKELSELLINSGYLTQTVHHFDTALEEILDSHSDLVLLDISIPYTNGEVLLKEIREVSDIPVIMLTSRNNETDEVISMSYGADDYIVKPYNPVLLLLRIHNIFKRLEKHQSSLHYQSIQIIPSKGLLKNDEKEIILTKNEMIIFLCLYEHVGCIVSRDTLMMALWDNEEYLNDNALTVNMSRLRHKLSDLGLENVIETRKGSGYLLV